LSLARAREVAAFREKGPFYLILTEARDHIPGDARLLLPDIVYPFYLERRAIWADELSDPLLPGWFGDNQPEEWARQLEEYGITHVLMQWPQMAGGVNQTLVEQCRLEEIAANRAKPGKAGWILYRFPGRSPKE
jgi:hypothetical protein